MKGIIFTSFIEMVEERFSPDLADELISQLNLPSGGSYTTVGTYDHQEIIALVQELSSRINVPAAELVQSFGEYLFAVLADSYSHLFHPAASAFEFLQHVERYIHVEVRKMYPDAQLPSFSYEQPVPSTAVLTYSSSRPFADLAEGLIRGCFGYFNEPCIMTREDITGSDGFAARFVLQKGVQVHG